MAFIVKPRRPPRHHLDLPLHARVEIVMIAGNVVTGAFGMIEDQLGLAVLETTVELSVAAEGAPDRVR
jgi:hypothetical protein